MTSLQNKLKWIGKGLAEICPATYHYTHPPSAKPPYCIWAEDMEGDSFQADGHKGEQAIEGTFNYYTKKEFDPVLDAIQDYLDNNSYEWNLNSVQYETDTGLIHYEWRWSNGKNADTGTV